MDLNEARWRKSSRSADNGGACVEAARFPGAVAVRDSKNPGGPVLVFSAGAWRDFASGLKRR
ncbi:DUF397 domain-containing protein [Actinomadura scrupuli]|uniref:DUF397 domain-containing protein n=1 Tax=Actinomadura scrupuli TaxID=559629 RepID=UPI003D97209D